MKIKKILSWGCKWSKRPPDMEGSCQYIEYAVAESKQGMVLQLDEIKERGRACSTHGRD
jgi:hypothetical protein